MADTLKHLDTHGEEIRDLVEKIVHGELIRRGNDAEVCSKCLALALLEIAAYASTSAGASIGEILESAASGAISAEDELEMAEAEPPTPSRH